MTCPYLSLLRISALATALLAASLPQASDLVDEQPQESMLRAIAEKLRCPVCQGENLYDSQSELAVEMRTIIREQLGDGRSEDEIVAFFVDRYGDYVRLEPPPSLAVLWWLPLALGLPAGALMTWLLLRRRPRVADGESARRMDR